METKTKLNKSGLLKKVILGAGTIATLASCSGEQEVRTDVYQGERWNEGIKTLYFNPNVRETRDDSKTYTVQSNQDLVIGEKYNIYETPGFFGKELDSITPYKTN